MRRFLFLALFLSQSLFLAVHADAAERVALVFGNGDYQNAPRLANPLNDAADIAATFERLGFHVKLIKNATFDTMRRGLLDFAGQAQMADIAMVYFAGHGLEIRDENWLIPVDAELRMDVSASQEAVGLGSILPIVAKASKLGLVILDACRDNPFGRQLMSQPSRAVAPRGLIPVEPPASVLVVFAAKHGTTADDGAGRNSPFTTALLHNLEIPGLEVNYLFRNIHDEVYAATGRHQEPYMYGTLSKEPIYLKPLVAPSVPLAPSSADAAQTWAAIKATESPDVLGRFIDRFGDTIYGALALERLWAILKDTTDQAAIEEFIAKYGSSSFGSAARARLAELKKMKLALVSSVQTAQPPTIEKDRKSEADIRIYDGKWTLVHSNSCGKGGTYAVSIKDGVMSFSLGGGRISSDGHLSARFTFLLSHGRLSGKMSSNSAASGTWTDQVGCGGNWNMHRNS
jgi:hypothetical protein